MKIHTKSQLACYRQISNLRKIKRILNTYSEAYNLIGVSEDKIYLSRRTPHKYEIVNICNGAFIEHTIYEKRPYGIIVTQIEQYYDTTVYSKGQNILVNLYEQRYVLTNEKLNQIIYSPESLSPKQLFIRLKSTPIDTLADMQTAFSAGMEYMRKDDDDNWYKSYMIVTKAKLNGEDVSSIYNDVNGNDKIYRIYDLYNGVINERNMQDIANIKVCTLTSEAFRLKDKKGITEKEDELVGTTYECIDYPKEIFIQNLNNKNEPQNDIEKILVKI